MGVVLRRRFGLDRGAITAYEDEHLQDRAEHEVRSQILAEEIERPRVGPMRDIVATIQPEQDEIVRAGARPDDLRPGRARAPARPPSACTARPGCSTRSATGWPAPACW